MSSLPPWDVIGMNESAVHCYCKSQQDLLSISATSELPHLMSDNRDVIKTQLCLPNRNMINIQEAREYATKHYPLQYWVECVAQSLSSGGGEGERAVSTEA